MAQPSNHSQKSRFAILTRNFSLVNRSIKKMSSQSYRQTLSIQAKPPHTLDPIDHNQSSSFPALHIIERHAKLFVFSLASAAATTIDHRDNADASDKLFNSNSESRLIRLSLNQHPINFFCKLSSRE